MLPTDARPAPVRPLWRKTPPQGLRLRRFQRQLTLARLGAPAAAGVAPRMSPLRRPAA